MPIRVADSKLQLALIDEVQCARFGYGWVERYRQKYEALATSKTWDELSFNDSDHVPELKQLLAQVEIELDDLRSIKSLTLDGDRALYGWVYPSWWDFGDHFAIRDLSGLEHCSAVEYLLLGQGLVSGASLRPIGRMSRLRELHLCAMCRLRDVPALLEIPTMRRLSIVNVATSPERASWESVMTELRQRGVTV